MQVRTCTITRPCDQRYIRICATSKQFDEDAQRNKHQQHQQPAALIMIWKRMGAAAQHILNEENSSNKLNLFQVIDIFQARRSEERNMKTRAVPGEGRLSWDRHVEYLHEINLFESVYRMKEKTFNKLVDKIWYKIAVDELQSMRSTSSNDPIYPEMVVALGICFLGGELPKSLFELYRLSLTLVEQVIDKFILAVANCDNLAIKLQETEGELFDLAEGFKNISGADDLFYGVVAALDEWLCTSESP